MKKITVNGKHGPIECANLVMGAGDFLRIDNMDYAAPILDRYFELGGNTFDTARHYRHSEKAIGAWMESRKNRDKVIIQTKGAHPVRGALDVPRVTSEAIHEDLATSLEMLKTDHVELFALHRDDETVPVAEIMEALHKEVESGLTFAIGVSNWELDRIIQANEYAQANGLTPLSFNSPNLSLPKVNRPRWENCVSANDEMILWHEKTNLPLFSWSSQAGGFFSGRFSPENRDDEEMVEVYYSDANWERYRRAKKLGAKLGVSAIQVSLAYVLHQSFPTAAVIGPETLEELASSYEASRLKLTQAQVNWLDLREE
ncbi:aldo/keto reductase [Listeria kieliensis]|uniref:Aldo/keto reductase n=1 Tax=Listeria kieliensis TaxID=1621700 RepID=A0A3D8TVT5_9LIST|nr:aldo/keto reductase [Listeria kieliensis]RDX02949.1 aldo/keto reductase [Listeria kieliensis]